MADLTADRILDCYGAFVIDCDREWVGVAILGAYAQFCCQLLAR